MKPYPHQVEIFRAIGDALRARQTRFVVKAPTGAGKTFIAAEFVRRAVLAGKRCAFVVPAISLVNQTLERFWSHGIQDIGVMQANHPLTNFAAPVQVCSKDTLSRRGWYPEVHYVIVDECHIRSKFVSEWMQDHPEIIFIGLSATPWAKGMAKDWHHLINKVTTRMLIERGILSNFIPYTGEQSPDLKGVRTQGGDWHQGQLSERSNKEPLIADIVQTWLKRGNNEPTLCYAVDRVHAKAIHDKFEQAGIGVGYCDAFTEIPERQELFRKLKAGEIRIICNVGTLTTGIDEDIRCIILARSTKSEMLYVQIVGRGLRTAPGKDKLILLDHTSTTERLGFVDDIDYDELDDGTPKEKGAQAVKKEKLPKKCPSCKHLKPAGVWECPQCGFKPQKQSQVEHVDGELKELKRAKIDHYQTYCELLWYARKHGKKDGWAWHKTRERCGRAPEIVHHLEPIPVTGDTLNWIVSRNIRYAKRRRA